MNLEDNIKMSVWDFSAKLTRRLLIWSVLSVLVSAFTFFSVDLFLRGLGIQFFAWGVIDGAIAIFSARASVKKQLNINESERAESEVKEARWLDRILWINTGLDVFYVIGGFWLMQSLGLDNFLWRGHGVGIVIQGGFLLFFDIHHAVSLRNLQIN